MRTKLSERVRPDCEVAPWVLEEIIQLEKSCEHHRQTALDISEDNDQLQKQIEEQNQRMQDLFQKAERLEKLVPPESERGPGFVGQGTWSVFAEKVVAERDEAREEIRILAKENKDLKAELAAKREHANIHYGSADFLGIDGYGPFKLQKIDRDRWEVHLLREKVTLYNKRGRRVRGEVDNSGSTYDGDW